MVARGANTPFSVATGATEGAVTSAGSPGTADAATRTDVSDADDAESPALTAGAPATSFAAAT
jgi:hypothetical protein